MKGEHVTTTTTLSAFDIDAPGHYRYRFRDWAREHFPYLLRFPSFARPEELAHFCRNRDALMEAVRQVLRCVEERSGPELRQYYAGNLERIQGFYDANDDTQFCFWVDELLGGIDFE